MVKKNDIGKHLMIWLSLMMAYIGFTKARCQTTFTAVSELKITTKSGLCISLLGDVQTYTLQGKEFLTGNFTIQECGRELVHATIFEGDRLSLATLDSCVTFDYISIFYDPKTKEYNDYAAYRKFSFCLGQDGKILITDRYCYKAPQLSESAIHSFISTLDETFSNDSLLIAKVNSYGFADMLFYCAMAGNEKATTYFSRLKQTLKDRNLFPEVGGEPVQIYQQLKLIFDNQ